ncbi:hypothetical protein [Flavobacterium notoginsengisoli]|uniref:hypothetical protein n=1 Tax=Flavobacterium notoginsengisoli TaxID=1478199 RepID=UPI0036D3919B
MQVEINMKKFIQRLSIFTCVVLFILVLGALMPPTPRSKTSLLFSKLDKDSLMKNVKGDRLILIGGSNLSFGINSQMLKDSLKFNPINNGIHAALGLEYLLNEAAPYIKEGDVIIISPEYTHFYGNTAYGSEVLCRMFFDVDFRKGNEAVTYMSFKQWQQILMYCPKYVASKFDPLEYFPLSHDPVYSRDSFNQFGDAVAHYNLPPVDYLALDAIDGKFNEDIVEKLKEFRHLVLEKKARLFITFPAVDEQSYQNNKTQINKIYQRLQDDKFLILGTQLEFIVSNDMIFNAYCHLNKKGTDYRTQLLIKELKKEL